MPLRPRLHGFCGLRTIRSLDSFRGLRSFHGFCGLARLRDLRGLRSLRGSRCLHGLRGLCGIRSIRSFRDLRRLLPTPRVKKGPIIGHLKFSNGLVAITVNNALLPDSLKSFQNYSLTLLYYLTP
jgi:hypothetical protein